MIYYFRSFILSCVGRVRRNIADWNVRRERALQRMRRLEMLYAEHASSKSRRLRNNDWLFHAPFEVGDAWSAMGIETVSDGIDEVLLEEAVPPIQAVFRLAIICNENGAPEAWVSPFLNMVREVYASHPKTAELLIQRDGSTLASNAVLVVHWWNASDLLEYLREFHQMTSTLCRRCNVEMFRCDISNLGLSIRYSSQTDCDDAGSDLFSHN